MNTFAQNMSNNSKGYSTPMNLRIYGSNLCNPR